MLQRSSMNSILLFLLYLGGASATVSSADSFGGTAFDYDGDHIADIAVRRPETFFHYVSNSANSDIQRKIFGRHENDIPVTGDFDGDGIFDFGVRRPSNQTWYILNSSGTDLISGNDDGITRLQFGRSNTDIPVPADYDGDGRTDIAVRRTSNQTWYIHNSTGVDTITHHDDGITRLKFGLQATDIPVPADYDGDGKADVAVRRASSQFWYIKNSAGQDLITNNDDGITRLAFGRNENDIPVPADYDGDGKADLAVRRPSSFQWYIKNSSGVDSLSGSSDGISRITFGRNADDIPVIADYDGDNNADIAVRRADNQAWYIRNSSGIDNRSNFSDGISRQQFGLQVDDIPLAMPAHLIWLDSDVDYDGVSNEAEAQYGTDIGLSDTDGDGLSDGDEINIYQTNPTNSDSDSDGVSDGVEIAAGTDPNTSANIDITTFNSAFLSNLSGYLSYGDRVVDGLPVPYADVWSFKKEIAVKFDSYTNRGPVNREYTYSIKSEELLSLSTTDLDQKTVDCAEPFFVIGRAFPDEVVNRIGNLCAIGAFENHSFLMSSGASEFTWQLINANEGSFKVAITQRFSYVLELPQAVLETWDETLPLRVDVESSLGEFDFIHVNPNLMPAMLDVELNGEWSMPLFYLSEIDRNYVRPFVIENFYQDRVTFDSQRVDGTLSAKSFTLEILDSNFILTNGEEQLTVTPLEQFDKTFLVEIKRSLNNNHVFTYVSLMSKFDASGVDFVANPTTDLPNVYAWTGTSRLKEYRQEGKIVVDNIYAYHLKPSGEFYRGIESSSRNRFYTGWKVDDMSWRADVEQNSLIFSQDDLYNVRTDYWEVINISSTGHIVVQEKSIIGQDRNGDGEIATNEFYHWILPRIIMLEVVDLSTYGDRWLNSHFDDDGLSNGEELELGTSLDNSDTDGDGFSDGDEVIAGSDPLDSDSLPAALGDIDFIDANLKTCQFNYNAYSDDTVVATINSLSCYDKSITNLQGMEQLIALEFVSLERNAITDLTPLSELTSIRGLQLDHNQITTLESLQNLSNLESLSFASNQISGLSGVAQLVNLSYLYASDNLVTDLSPLGSLPIIEQLHLQNNAITSIEPLLNLNSLQYVDVRGNDNLACEMVDDFERTMYPARIVKPASCPKLLVDTSLFIDANLKTCIEGNYSNNIIDTQVLTCEDMGIVDLTGIEQLFALRSMNMNDNQITDFSPLQAVSQSLKSIDFERNNIVDVSPFSELANLGSLNLEGNSISDISSLNLLSELYHLDLAGNQLTELPDLSNLQELRRLFLSDNQISEIDSIVLLNALEELELSNNLLSTVIDFAQLQNLLELDLSGNSISDIGLLDNTDSLQGLDLSNNQIVNIDTLSELGNIKELYLNDNSIQDVSSLSSSENLKVLVLSNNQISDVSSLSSLGNVYQLDLSHNSISDIESLSRIVGLRTLNLSHNILVDVSSLGEFNYLDSITLDHNNINVLPELQNDSLSWISVEHNNLSDLSPLAKHDFIEELRISGNQINDLTPLADITFLYRMHAADNGIEDLSPLAIHSDQMRELYIQNNDFSDLSTLFDFTRLETLDLSENTQISCSLLDQLGEALTDTVITLPETCSN